MTAQQLINILTAFEGASNYQNQPWLTATNGYPVYYQLAWALKPKTVLEIGTYLGFSMAAIMLGSGQVQQAVCIDNQSYNPFSNHLAARNLQQVEKNARITFHTTYPALTYKQFDLVHIDGEHTASQKLHDLNYAAALTRTIWVDDYHYNKDFIPQVITRWQQDNPGWQLHIEETYRGLAVLTKT